MVITMTDTLFQYDVEITHKFSDGTTGTENVSYFISENIPMSAFNNALQNMFDEYNAHNDADNIIAFTTTCAKKVIAEINEQSFFRKEEGDSSPTYRSGSIFAAIR